MRSYLQQVWLHGNPFSICRFHTAEPSEALILPIIYQQLTLFSQWHHRPHYFKASLFAFSLTLSASLSPSSPFSLSFSRHKQSSRPIFILRMLFHTLRHSHCHTYTHSSVMSLEQTQDRNSRFILNAKTFWKSEMSSHELNAMRYWRLNKGSKVFCGITGMLRC